MKDLKQFNKDAEYFCININYHIRKKKKSKTYQHTEANFKERRN